MREFDELYTKSYMQQGNYAKLQGKGSKSLPNWFFFEIQENIFFSAYIISIVY